MNPAEPDKLTVDVARQVRSRFYGKYRGLVDEVGEGKDLGLIRAIVPEVFGADTPTPWAVASVPFAGKNHGLVVLPEKDDLVWIEFEAGNLSKPIWTGFLWADNEMPTDASPTVRVLATTGKLQIVLDDESDELRLEHGSGASIVLADSKITLKVGSQEIVISSSSVSVNSGNLEVK